MGKTDVSAYVSAGGAQFETLRHHLFCFARRLGVADVEADDLVQDTLLALLSSHRFGNLDEMAKSAYSRIVLLNLVRASARSRRRAELRERAWTFDVWFQAVAPNVDLLRGYERSEMLLSILKQIATELSLEVASAFVICDLYGITRDNAARVLDIPVGTLNTRVRRARHFLRDELKVDFAFV
jgi:DNA-directed RNA polymerase specialized sigma24 family protein